MADVKYMHAPIDFWDKVMAHGKKSNTETLRGVSLTIESDVIEALNVAAKNGVSKSSAVNAALKTVFSPRLDSIPLGEKKNLPPVSGVYLVCNGAEVVYVGKSKNLRSRFCSHNKAQLFNALDECRVHYFTCSDELISPIELALISYFSPRLNCDLSREEALMKARTSRRDATPKGYLAGQCRMAIPKEWVDEWVEQSSLEKGICWSTGQKARESIPLLLKMLSALRPSVPMNWIVGTSDVTVVWGEWSATAPTQVQAILLMLEKVLPDG
jgi:hypothetical protein